MLLCNYDLHEKINDRIFTWKDHLRLRTQHTPEAITNHSL